MPTMDGLLHQSMCLHQAGDFASAATGYAKVLSAQPENADAWHLAGVLAHQNGRPQDAIKQIQMAISIDSEKAEYFSNLAAILNGIQQPNAALDAARQALRIDYHFAQGHFQAAKACGNLERFLEAIQSFDRTIQCGGDAAAISLEIASVLQMQGMIPEAIAQLESVLSLSPSHPQAFVELAKFVATGDFAFSQTQLQSLESLTNHGTNLATKDRARLCSALASSLERQQDYPAAYRSFDLANRWMTNASTGSATQRFDPSANKRFVKRSIEYFSQQAVEELRTNGSESSLPIFVVGMPRSGTTLIHQLLSNHKQVQGLGELTQIQDLFFELFHEQTDRAASGWPPLSPAQIQSASNRYVTHVEGMIHSDRIKRTIDKMPGNYNFLGLIRMMFPQAKIIHCVRDPRDVCLSCYFTQFDAPQLQSATSSIDNLAVMYKSYHRLMKHWKPIFGADIYDLSYRRLVSDPQSEIASLLTFLGLPFDAACVQTDPGSDAVVRTASVAQVRKPIHASSVGRWRNYEDQFAPMMRHLHNEILDFEQTFADSATS